MQTAQTTTTQTTTVPTTVQYATTTQYVPNNSAQYNNNNNNNNVSGGLRFGIILLSIFVFLCLVLIHVAYYIYVRNMGYNSLGAGYTGWSAGGYMPFFDGVSEFIPLGFIILPLVLLSIAFLGRWFDLASCVVALIFAVIDLVVILFATVGVIVVYHLDRNNPYNTNVNNTYTYTNITTYTYNNVTYTNNNSTTYNNGTANNNNSYCHNAQGVFANAFCHAQSVLVAGMVCLLFAQFLVVFLATRALHQAKQNWLANTAPQYNNSTVVYNPAVVYPPSV